MWCVRLLSFALLVNFQTIAADSVPADSANASWTFLRKAVVDGNPEHRREALSALSSIGGSDDAAVNLVENVLSTDKDAVVRQTAAAALGLMKARQAIPALKTALDDPSDEVAFQAAKSLTDMGDTSGQEVIKGVLAGNVKTGPNMVTGAIRDAKHKLRHPQILFWMGAEDVTGTFLGPAAMGLPVAKDAFSDKGAGGRAAAAASLDKDPDPYALTLLEWAVTDDSWGVRLAAAKALGTRGNDNSIPKLKPLMDDKHFSVQCMAAASIIHIQDRDNGTPTTSVTTLGVKKK